MFGIKTRTKKLLASLLWQADNYYAYFNRQKSVEIYIKSHKIRKLNLGCWPYLFDGWLNTDLYGSKELVPLDLTKPFPIRASVFDYIFCEHTLEHFSLTQGASLLGESLRILKPGGKIRFSMPDINFLISLYGKNKAPVQKKYLKWAMEEFGTELNIQGEAVVINNFFHLWGHQFIYDYKTIKQLLESVGFVNIKKYKPGQSKDTNLQNLESHGKSIGEDFNNLESLVIEAKKP